MIVPFENGEEEFDIKVEFDHEPFEPMTRHYPGSPENVAVNFNAIIVETGVKICLLPCAEDGVADDVLEKIHEENDERKIDARYGYMKTW